MKPKSILFALALCILGGCSENNKTDNRLFDSYELDAPVKVLFCCGKSECVEATIRNNFNSLSVCLEDECKVVLLEGE